MQIEFTPQFERALHLMEETGKNVFITGRAGTGKSTLLHYFRENTKKKIVVLAPTGVAAVNVKGQTIHSFFGFKPDITLEKVKNMKVSRKSIYREVDAILIDEISMVRADLLDCVDGFLRKNGRERNRPFGGIQMIFFGDLYQLPPVVKGKEKDIFRRAYSSPYFFDSKAFRSCEFEFVELEKIYRQHDPVFIEILNSIRNNTITDEQLNLLNSRVMPDFEPSGKEFYIQLTTLNDIADEINRSQLKKLRGKTYRYRGVVEGEFDEKSLPTDIELEFKRGAQIMLVNNDPRGRWINGTLGRVIDVIESEEEEDVVVAELEDGEEVGILPYRWDVFRFDFDENSNTIFSETVGSFIQYPFILAWAITIHKSQGKTFDRVIIDIGRGTFAHGQVYVALSRCRSLDGIVLKKPIRKKHIFMDRRVVKFLTEFQYALSEKSIPLEKKMEIIRKAMEKGCMLKITYLKRTDEKSVRVVKPIDAGEMEYLGKRFYGMKAMDELRKEERVFRIDRILDIEEE